MIYTCAYRCIIQCFFICYVQSDSFGTKKNGDCVYNSYKDGDVCKDCPAGYFGKNCTDKYCPAGYFGKNCTDKCKHPTFGFLCSETCDCPVCHHIVGCISTAVNKENPNEDCLYNSYKEGDVCKDCPAGYFGKNCTDKYCPAGYFGKNCTDKCKHPTFGFLCSETCDCPVCHHIVGCVSTTVNIDVVPENDISNRPEQMTNSTHMIKLIIISSGAVITVVLLIFILLTMRNGFTSANINVNSHRCEDVQVDNVYAEISR